MNYLFVYVVQSWFLLLVTKTATWSVTALSRKQTFRSSLEAVGGHSSLQYSLGPPSLLPCFPNPFLKLSLPAALLTPCIDPSYHIPSCVTAYSCLLPLSSVANTYMKNAKSKKENFQKISVSICLLELSFSAIYTHPYTHTQLHTLTLHNLHLSILAGMCFSSP